MLLQGPFLQGMFCKVSRQLTVVDKKLPWQNTSKENYPLGQLPPRSVTHFSNILYKRLAKVTTNKNKSSEIVHTSAMEFDPDSCHT